MANKGQNSQAFFAILWLDKNNGHHEGGNQLSVEQGSRFRHIKRGVFYSDIRG